MNTPFTQSDFLDVFARYNEATWPVTYILVAMALSAVLGVFRGARYRDRWASGVLAMLWGWSGIAFHLAFFADVNPVAIVFGILFLVQGAGFFRCGVWRHQLVVHVPLERARGIAGLIVMVYAIVVYPLLSGALGHRWPHAPSFGAPCPVDLFTLGLLLWTKSPVPKFLLVVPLGWALVAAVGAWEFGMHEDWGLAMAAVVAAAWLLPRRREEKSPQPRGHAETAVSPRIWKHVSKT